MLETADCNHVPSKPIEALQFDSIIYYAVVDKQQLHAATLSNDDNDLPRRDQASTESLRPPNQIL